MKRGQLESGMNGGGCTDGHGLGNPNGTLIGADLGHGSVAAKERKDRKGRRRAEYRLSTAGDEPFGDPITRAWAREREARRWLSWPEDHNRLGRVFQCVCCGRVRSEEERREPRTCLCIRCVREAGFWN